MGYRDHYNKTFDELLCEELKHHNQRHAIIYAKSKHRMYANLFCRDMRVMINESSKCIKCGSNDKLTIDHIIPISKGGKNTITNVQILCRKCNRTKGSKMP